MTKQVLGKILIVLMLILILVLAMALVWQAKKQETSLTRSESAVETESGTPSPAETNPEATQSANNATNEDIEVKLQTLNSDLYKVDLRESQLALPVLDMNIVIK